VKMKKSVILLAFAVFFAIFFAVRIIKKEIRPPDIVLISIDTLRQDHVGTYGYSRKITPVLDSLASEGVKFLQSYSTAPWTLPSHMSMFTGLPPSEHKLDFDIRALGSEIKTFPEFLKKEGYRTGAFVSAVYLKKEYGFSRGFDSYNSDFRAGAEKVTHHAIQWMKKRESGPFFLFIHYFDAHWPYSPPLKYAVKTGVDHTEKSWKRYGRLPFLRKYSNPDIDMSPGIHQKVINLYDAEIMRVDASVGKIIDYLKQTGKYENTILVITSDHGEEFKEHGSFGHFHQLYAELISVPLIIRYPRSFTQGSVSKVPVSSMDIGVTLLRLAGAGVPDQFLKHGFSLTEIYDKKEGKAFKRKLISETRKGCTHHFASISDGYKYISPYRYRPMIKNKFWVDVDTKLFSMDLDKKETQNLMGRPLNENLRSGVVAPAREKIEKYIQKNIDAVRIIFFPPSDSESVLSGTISYRNIPELTPFGLGFRNSDKIIDNTDGRSTDFTLTMNQNKKEIVLHLSKILQKCTDFNIKIFCNGKPMADRTFNIGKLSKAQLVVKSENGSVYIMKNGGLYKSRKPGITDREKALLKSLGYIN